jgi:lysophospholipase L1-like esterase
MATVARPHSKRRRIVVSVVFVAVGIIAGAAIACAISPAVRVRAINTLLWFDVRLRPQHIPITQRWLDRWVPADAVMVAGDSFAVMLPERWIDARAIDFGLGGATTQHVRAHLQTLSAIGRARSLVLLVGSNDLVHRPTEAEDDLRSLLADLPAGLPVLLCTIPPVDPSVHRARTPAAIAQLNARWATCAAARSGTHLVRVETALADRDGRLRSDFSLGDGLHLNAAGNRALAKLVRDTLQKVAP